MKLQELNLIENSAKKAAGEFFANRDKLLLTHINSGTINEDGSVNVIRCLNGNNVTLNNQELFSPDGYFPFKFDKCPQVCFNLHKIQAKSWDFLPTECLGIDLSYSNISNFDNIPALVGNYVDITYTHIKSFSGIENIIFDNVDGLLKFDAAIIKENYLQLLNCKGLGRLTVQYSGKKYGVLPDNPLNIHAGPHCIFALNIIAKYLNQPDKIFECQSELIDVGLEEFAQL